jgi:hypothetical protein
MRIPISRVRSVTDTSMRIDLRVCGWKEPHPVYGPGSLTPRHIWALLFTYRSDDRRMSIYCVS